MMYYEITNTTGRVQSYTNEQGQQITVGPGETVKRKSRPGRPNGWDVEELPEEPQTDEEDSEGGEE